MGPVAVCKWPILTARVTTIQDKVSMGQQSHICVIDSYNCDRARENRSCRHIQCYEKNRFEVLKLLWFCCAGL